MLLTMTTTLYMAAIAPCCLASASTTTESAKPAADQAVPDGTTAAAAFERLKSLKGEWIDKAGTFAEKGKVGVVYEIVGGGNVVMERLFMGQPHEMVSMYHLDGDRLVMTHYCAAGNQPRMKADRISRDRIDFDFSGGSNLDPAKDSHMHNGFLEWTDPDHVQGKWFGWSGGKPSEHVVAFELERKKKAMP